MLGLGLALSIAKKTLGDAIDGLLSTLRGRATYYENGSASKSTIKAIDNADVLDKATILLTPTATSDARVHSVKTYTGDELVTNGTFDTDSDWSGVGEKGWSISNGKVRRSGYSVNSDIRQNVAVVNGGTYKFSYTRSYESGDGQTNLYIQLDNANYSTLGIYDSTVVEEHTVEGYFTTTFTGNLLFRIFGISDFTGTIDNVSIVDVSSDFDFDRASSATRINSSGLVQDMQSITDPELVLNGDFEELGSELVTNGTFDTDSDWFTLGDWAISGGLANCNGSSIMYTNASIIANKTYKVTYTVSGFVSGGVKIKINGSPDTDGLVRTANGTYTEYITSSSSVNGNFSFAAVVSFIGSIDNVSVQQVDPNDRWSVTNSDADNYVEFTEGFARLKFLNTSPITMLNSTLTLQANKTYELVVDVHDVTSGSIKIDAAGLSELFNEEGVTTRYLKPTGNTTLSFYRATADVDITLASVSVKDITFSTEVDLARINYDSNGENGHILLEPTSTNLVSYSEDFSEWTKTGGTTISATNILSPSGENNGTNISGLSGSGGNDLKFFVSSFNSASKTLTVSVYLKGSGTLRVQMSNGVDQGFDDTITLSSNWTRYTLTATFNSTNSGNLFHVNIDDSGATATSYDIWGVQLEELPYATSYIPTLTGSTVTRATETLTGSGNSTLINSTEGVLYAEISALANDGTFRVISLSDGTTSNSLWLYYTTVSDKIQVFDGSNIIAHSIDVTNFIKVAVVYDSNGTRMWVNGSQVGSNTFVGFSGLNKLNFINENESNYNFKGKCKALAVFNEALSDTELENLTS
jgi:hypothetical protein